MNRYEEMKSILDDQKYFKVICGAGNEDPEEVIRNATLIAGKLVNGNIT